MIKCDATVCGVVAHAAEMKINREGQPFLSYELDVVLPAREGVGTSVRVKVVHDGDLQQVVSEYYLSRRVQVVGTLSFSKVGEQLCFHMKASTAAFVDESTEDVILGTMQFRGKTGKQEIVERTDKRGKPYVQFSAYSARKVSDGFEYVWVRFFWFDQSKPEWLQPATPIQAEGELNLGVFNGSVSLGCHVAAAQYYERPPYNPQS